MKMSAVLCMLFLTGAAEVGWIEIENRDKDQTSYVNTSNIRVAGDKAYYWQKIVYAKPRLVDGKWSSSEFNNAVINCVTSTQAFLYLSWYDGANASGQLTKFAFHPENGIEFHPIAPDSVADMERKIVCSGRT